MVGIKQTLVEKKINKRDLKDALMKRMEDITGWTKSVCESVLLNFNSTISVLVVRNKKLKEYLVITVGASNKTITAVERDLSEHRYYYEYILKVSAEQFKNKTVKAVEKEFNTGKTNEALEIAYRAALLARDNGPVLLDNMNFGLKTSEKEDKSLVVITKRWEKEEGDEEIEIDTVGRVGKLKLIQLVVCNSKESEILIYLGDTKITTLVGLCMFRDKLDAFYKNREETYNFIKLIPKEKLTSNIIKKHKIKKNENKEYYIDSVEQFNELLNDVYKD